MKMIIDRKWLIDGITKCAKGTVKKATIKLCENVSIIVKNGKCMLISTDLENMIVISRDVDAIDMAFTFQDTLMFLKAAKYYTGDTIALEKIDDNKINIECGNKKSTIMVNEFDDEVLNSIPTMEKAEQYIYTAEKINNRYNIISYAIAKTDTYPILKGIYFNASDMVACDAFRIAINKDEELSVNTPFTIQEKCAELLTKVIPQGNITLEVNDKYIHISDNYETDIYSRLLAGNYINYKTFISNNNATVENNIDIQKFINELKYLKAFRIDTKLSVVMEGHTLSVKNSNGQFNVTIDGLNLMRQAFDVIYLLEAIGQFKNNEYVTFYQYTELSPAKIVNENNTAVIYPIRIKE